MMIRIYIFFITVLLFSPAVFAQKVVNKSEVNKGFEHISRHTIEAHLAFLASDAVEGRAAGKNSGRIAAEYIKAVLLELGVQPLYTSYFQPFEAFAPHSGDFDIKTAFQVHPDSVAAIKKEAYYRRLGLQNVLGYIEGQRKDEYVVIGAHYDHLGVDEFLVGDPIFNGADDNAASVAAVLQVAKVFAINGIKPLRSIIFAFWDAEEYGFLGSEYFVANFKNPATIKAYVNLDMISREGSFPSFLLENQDEASAIQATDLSRIYFLHTADAAEYLPRLDKNLAAHRLEALFAPRILRPAVRASDDHSFSNKNVPVLWFFTGIHPDYHTPDDETDKINWDKLLYITKATCLVLWDVANEK
jgi:Zn-dependent M28 family amino/carboxypeptidase